MKHWIRNYMRAFSAVVSDLAAACLILALLPLITKQQVTIPMAAWVFALSVQLAVNEYLLTKGVSFNFYIVVNGVMVMGTGALLLWFLKGPLSAVAFAVLGAAVGAVGCHCALVGKKLPDSNGLSAYADGLIAALAFYLYAAFDTGWQEDMLLILVALTAIGIDLIVVNQLRTGEECEQVIYGAGAGGRMILFLVMAGCMVLAGGLAGAASGQLHNIVDVLAAVLKWCMSILGAVLGFFGRVIGGILNYLFSLLPDAEPINGRRQTAIAAEAAQESAENASAMSEWVGALVLALLVVAGIAAVMRQFKDVKVKRERTETRQVKVVRKSHVWASIGAVLKRIWQKLSFEWEYHRFRRTPQGLLIFAERHCHSRKLKRQSCESPGEFIRRLDGILQENENHEEGSLQDLADMLDRVLYAGQECGLSSEQYRMFVRLIRSVS